MTKPPKKTAFVYDFDGTLAQGNIQEHSFIPQLDLKVREFWSEVKELAEKHDADEILTYMWRMLERAREKGLQITREMLKAHGAKTPIFAGVDSWFPRMNEHAKGLGLELEHYVISSGIYEMIRGCSIFDALRWVFASRFTYDENGAAVWPSIAINYTTKTQYLFRINKGILNSWDNDSLNKWVPMDERPVPFSRMVFFGDGDTDIPSMKMVRHQGGHSIAVFDPQQWGTARSQEKVHKLIAEDRVNFVAPAEFAEGSQLDVIAKGILGRMGRSEGFRPE